MDEPQDQGAERRDPPTPLIGALEKFDHAIGVVEQAALCALLLALVGVAAGRAIANRLFDMQWGWSHEVIRYSVFFIAMTGAALSAQTERLISMDFVYRQLRPRLRVYVRQALRLFTIAVSVFLILGGLEIRDAVAGEDYQLLSKANVALALPVGGGLIAFHVGLHMIIDLLYLGNGELPPEGEEPAAH